MATPTCLFPGFGSPRRCEHPVVTRASTTNIVTRIARLTVIDFRSTEAGLPAIPGRKNPQVDRHVETRDHTKYP
jgi:hypothetical protein